MWDCFLNPAVAQISEHYRPPTQSECDTHDPHCKLSVHLNPYSYSYTEFLSSPDQQGKHVTLPCKRCTFR